MKIGILSNIFKEYSENEEVEDDLMQVGKLVYKALTNKGHNVEFFDVNEKTFEVLRKSDIDIAFNVCERFNGSSFHEPNVAAMLELLNIPYTGSGPLPLALCMNKPRVKEIMMHHNIPTPNWQVFYSRNKKLREDMKFPLIVKPAQMDNSIGIDNNAIVNDEKELQSKVGYINRTYNQPALVEEYIPGRDLDVGVIGNGFNAKVLPIAEVSYNGLSNSFNKIFSYEAKWDKQCELYRVTDYLFDMDVPKCVEARIKRIALDLYRILDLRDYGRVDIRLGEDNVPYVLEMNPNPGISCDCSTPMAAESLGMSYDDMIEMILENALDRYNLKNQVQPVVIAQKQ
ncbi:ATP-grasp domain-containing protein [Candidatus Woesearchaeota archaeon]|nr:ATP-grasp domain-containing protein [Candidatus Woesearchaeota archaeon]